MTVLVYATLVIALASLVFDIVATYWHFHDRKHLHGGGHANHVAEIVVSKINELPALRAPNAEIEGPE